MTPEQAVLLDGIGSARDARECEARAVAVAQAPAFNPVALLGPGETGLSLILRWLFDERGNHGQGGRFRDLYLRDLLGFAEGDIWRWQGASAACEVPTRDRTGRIDILLLSADRQDAIAIENKPWAVWQRDQLARYLSDQRARGRSVLVHAIVGRSWNAAAEVAKRWAANTPDRYKTSVPPAVRASDFDAVIAWIEACASVASPRRIKEFLGDIARYLRVTVQGEPPMSNLLDTARAIVVAGSTQILAAREIAAALPKIHTLMTEMVANRVGGAVSPERRYNLVRIEVEGLTCHCAVFPVGGARPWIGINDPAMIDRLAPDLEWQSEPRWPRWVYIDRLFGEAGLALHAAIEAADWEAVADRLAGAVRELAR